MFWNKKSKNISLEERLVKSNLDYIRNALCELKKGNISYIPAVYSAFASKDEDVIKQAAIAIGSTLKNYTDQQMLLLDEQFRQYTSLEWYTEWSKVSLLELEKCMDDKDNWIKVLILGSFHPNGYFRERCVRELSHYEGTLPYLLLRMNDWVEAIRACTFPLIVEKVKTCSILELFSSLPFLDKIQKSQRRGMRELDLLQKDFSKRIEENIHTIEWFKIINYDFNTRKSIYNAVFEKPLLSFKEANRLLNLEKHSFCKSIIIQGILALYDCPMEQVDLYMKNKNSNVRMSALQYKYNKVKNSWVGLETMLLDTNHAIRDLTSYILKKHTVINVLHYYTLHLKDTNPNTAIVGIGENGDKNCAPLIIPFIENTCEKTVKLTLLSLGRLLEYDGYDLYWNYLFDSRVSVSKAAYLSIRRNKIHYGASVLYNEFNKCEIMHVKRYLLLLLMQENSWSRLPYLLLLYQYPDRNLRAKIRMKIEQRDVYGRVTQQEAVFIQKVMEEKKDELPQILIDKIEFDMKYVVVK
jgi:succinate dehydrogenase flavin-adding protein (antitoxin of CptAB toxin-antitoxin module)